MKKGDLTTGSIFKRLIALALPMMVGMVGMMVFNLVDTYFVGKLGKSELAAMSFTFPVVMFKGTLAMGLGIGASAVISQAIGRKDKLRTQELTTCGLMLGVLVSTVAMVIGFTTMDPVFKLLGADETNLGLIKQYMQVWFWGLPAFVIPMMGNNAIRAAGNTVIPSVVMMVAIVVNIVLDPILIFGWGPVPALGLAGAAWATIISRLLTLMVALYYLHFHFDMLRNPFRHAMPYLQAWREVLHIGLPAALSQMLLPLSVGVLTRLVAGYGEDAVAAFGIGGRIEMFALSPVVALCAVMTPFAGQNLGAQKFCRLRQTHQIGAGLAMAGGLLIAAILILCRRQAVETFNGSEEVVRIASLYLAVVPIGYGLQGVIGTSTALLNGLKRPLASSSLNILKLIVLMLPMAIIGSQRYGLPGIFAAMAISSVIAGGIAFVQTRRVIERLRSKVETPAA